jgi:hypothetical protein
VAGKCERMYHFLKTHLNAESLKELSLIIIDAYRSRNRLKLKLFAESISHGAPVEDEDDNRLFLRLIKHFHPDRLNYFLKDIESAFVAGDIEKLGFYHNLITAGLSVDRAYARRYDLCFSETYRYDEMDFGFSVSEEDEGSDERDDVEEEFDILRAVKAAYLGNLDFVLAPEDLASMSGDLDLSDFNIHDLEGLQYCCNVTRLNLSNNRIYSIRQIRHLVHLEELFISNNSIAGIGPLKGLSNLMIVDLSNNEIDDPSPLLELENLQFVNLENNPLADSEVVEMLMERCVVVR